MKIDVYTPPVSSYLPELLENLRQALAAAGLDAEIRHHAIDFDTARKLGIRGAPTIRINNRDAFEQKALGFA
jgi:hypothetical protein